jgi:hypothetical protein
MFWYAAADSEPDEAFDCVAVVAVRLWGIAGVESCGQFGFGFGFECVRRVIVGWHRVEEEIYVLDARCRSRAMEIRALRGIIVDRD